MRNTPCTEGHNIDAYRRCPYAEAKGAENRISTPLLPDRKRSSMQLWQHRLCQDVQDDADRTLCPLASNCCESCRMWVSMPPILG